MTPEAIKTLITDAEVSKHEAWFKYHALQRDMNNCSYQVYQTELDNFKKVAEHYQQCINELNELLTR